MPGDWYAGVVPDNVELGPGTYLESSYALGGFRSLRRPGLVLSEGAGAYDQVSFVVGPEGSLEVGPYSCLNGATLRVAKEITIGAHVFVGWGAVITDTWLSAATGLQERRAALLATARDPARPFPTLSDPRPVVVEDCVWIGFGSVVLPGVRLGRGCVIGARTVVAEDVPPLTVVAGDPPRVIRHLPDDAQP
jgi:acetyltransferase-like isoleucine patch superfamily enzyme